MLQLVLATPRYEDSGHRYLLADHRRLTGSAASALNDLAKLQLEGSDYIAVARPVKQVLKDGTQRDAHERLILTGSSTLPASQRAELRDWLQHHLETWEQHCHQPQGQQQGLAVQSDVIAAWETELLTWRSAPEAVVRDAPRSATDPLTGPRTSQGGYLRKLTRFAFPGIVAAAVSAGLLFYQNHTPRSPAQAAAYEATNSTAFLQNPAWSLLAKQTGLSPRPTASELNAWLRSVHEQYLPQEAMPAAATARALQAALTHAPEAKVLAQMTAQYLDAGQLLNSWPTPKDQPATMAALQALRGFHHTLQRSSEPAAQPLTSSDLAKLVRQWTSIAQQYAARTDIHPSLHPTCAEFTKAVRAVPAAPDSFDFLTPADLRRWQATEQFLFRNEALTSVLRDLRSLDGDMINGQTPETWYKRRDLMEHAANSRIITAAEVQLMGALVGVLPR